MNHSHSLEEAMRRSGRHLRNSPSRSCNRSLPQLRQRSPCSSNGRVIGVAFANDKENFGAGKQASSTPNAAVALRTNENRTSWQEFPRGQELCRSRVFPQPVIPAVGEPPPMPPFVDCHPRPAASPSTSQPSARPSPGAGQYMLGGALRVARHTPQRCTSSKLMERTVPSQEGMQVLGCSSSTTRASASTTRASASTTRASASATRARHRRAQSFSGTCMSREGGGHSELGQGVGAPNRAGGRGAGDLWLEPRRVMVKKLDPDPNLASALRRATQRTPTGGDGIWGGGIWGEGLPGGAAGGGGRLRNTKSSTNGRTSDMRNGEGGGRMRVGDISPGLHLRASSFPSPKFPADTRVPALPQAISPRTSPRKPLRETWAMLRELDLVGEAKDVGHSPLEEGQEEGRVRGSHDASSLRSSGTSASIPSMDELDRTPTSREYVWSGMDPVSIILSQDDPDSGRESTLAAQDEREEGMMSVFTGVGLEKSPSTPSGRVSPRGGPLFSNAWRAGGRAGGRSPNSLAGVMSGEGSLATYTHGAMVREALGARGWGSTRRHFRPIAVDRDLGRGLEF